MTITLFPDCEASSPDGRFTLEASCPGNRQNSDALQWDFRYRLLDGDRGVWERKQGDGEQPPHELWVSDEGWSILRTHGHSPQVIAISPDGRDELRVSVRIQPKDPTPGTPDNPRVRRAEWLLTRSSYSIRIGGGLYWSNDSWPYFLQVEGWSFFVWRTESGERLVLDLTQRTLVPENSPACAALTHAMEEEEQRGAHRLLWRLAARRYEVQELIACYRPSSTKKPPPLVTQLWLVPAALQLVGLYRCEEALPVLRCWEGIDFYRPRVHSALKQLGAEPQGATFHACPAPSERRSPVPDLGPYLRARAAELEPRMSAEQVPQPVGSHGTGVRTIPAR